MALRIYNSSAEAATDAVVDKFDDGAAAGTVEIRSGAQPAVNVALTGTVLADFTMSDPAFGAAAASGSGGVATAAGLPKTDASAAATGTAGYFAALDSDSNVLFTGTVTATGGGGDAEIDNTSITAGQEVQLTAFTYTQPQA